MKPLDVALDKIWNDMNKPPFEKFLDELIKKHNHVEVIEAQLEKEKKVLQLIRDRAIDYLDVLGVSTYTTKEGFKIFTKRYKEAKITDKKLFFSWLKENCSPEEVIELLTPPFTNKDLKEFITKKHAEADEKGNIDFKVSGVDINSEFIQIKTVWKEKEGKDETI